MLNSVNTTCWNESVRDRYPGGCMVSRAAFSVDFENGVRWRSIADTSLV